MEHSSKPARRSARAGFPALAGALLTLALAPSTLAAQSTPAQGVWPSWAFGSAPRIRLIQDRTHACLRRDEQLIYNNLLCMPLNPAEYPVPYDPAAPELDARIENGSWIGTLAPIGLNTVAGEVMPMVGLAAPFDSETVLIVPPSGPSVLWQYFHWSIGAFGQGAFGIPPFGRKVDAIPALPPVNYSAAEEILLYPWLTYDTQAPANRGGHPDTHLEQGRTLIDRSSVYHYRDYGPSGTQLNTPGLPSVALDVGAFTLQYHNALSAQDCNIITCFDRNLIRMVASDSLALMELPIYVYLPGQSTAQIDSSLHVNSWSFMPSIRNAGGQTGEIDRYKRCRAGACGAYWLAPGQSSIPGSSTFPSAFHSEYSASVSLYASPASQLPAPMTTEAQRDTFEFQIRNGQSAGGNFLAGTRIADVSSASGSPSQTQPFVDFGTTTGYNTTFGSLSRFASEGSLVAGSTWQGAVTSTPLIDPQKVAGLLTAPTLSGEIVIEPANPNWLIGDEQAALHQRISTQFTVPANDVSYLGYMVRARARSGLSHDGSALMQSLFHWLKPVGEIVSFSEAFIANGGVPWVTPAGPMPPLSAGPVGAKLLASSAKSGISIPAGGRVILPAEMHQVATRVWGLDRDDTVYVVASTRDEHLICVRTAGPDYLVLDSVEAYPIRVGETGGCDTPRLHVAAQHGYLTRSSSSGLASIDRETGVRSELMPTGYSVASNNLYLDARRELYSDGEYAYVSLFRTSPESVGRLYRSDGSDAPIEEVAHIDWPDRGPQPQRYEVLAKVGDALYFTVYAFNTSPNGAGPLFVKRGDAAPAQIPLDGVFAINRVVRAGDRLILLANRFISGFAPKTLVIETDGSVVDLGQALIDNGLAPTGHRFTDTAQIEHLGSATLLYDADGNVWASDGTLGSTRLIFDPLPGQAASNNVALHDGYLYFIAAANNGARTWLMRSDGSLDGTEAVDWPWAGELDHLCDSGPPGSGGGQLPLCNGRRIVAGDGFLAVAGERPAPDLASPTNPEPRANMVWFSAGDELNFQIQDGSADPASLRSYGSGVLFTGFGPPPAQFPEPPPEAPPISEFNHRLVHSFDLRAPTLMRPDAQRLPARGPILPPPVVRPDPIMASGFED